MIYRLEKIVFGDASDVINNLPDENHIEEANESKIARTYNTDNVEANEDILSENSDIDTNEQIKKKKVVWVDEDDGHYT